MMCWSWMDFATRDDEIGCAIITGCMHYGAARVGVGCRFGNGRGGWCVGLGAPQLSGAVGNWATG